VTKNEDAYLRIEKGKERKKKGKRKKKKEKPVEHSGCPTGH